MTDDIPTGKAGVTAPGKTIAEGQHTPYQVAAGLTDYKVNQPPTHPPTYSDRSPPPVPSSSQFTLTCPCRPPHPPTESPTHPPTHVRQMEEQLNWTAHRSRGYGVGSLNQEHGEPDKYWKQPGHPLEAKGKGKGGRFEVRWVGGWVGGQQGNSGDTVAGWLNGREKKGWATVGRRLMAFLAPHHTTGIEDVRGLEPQGPGGEDHQEPHSQLGRELEDKAVGKRRRLIYSSEFAKGDKGGGGWREREVPACEEEVPQQHNGGGEGVRLLCVGCVSVSFVCVCVSLGATSQQQPKTKRRKPTSFYV